MDEQKSLRRGSAAMQSKKRDSLWNRPDLDRSVDKLDEDHLLTSNIKKKGLLGRMRYHSDLLVELLPNPSDKCSARLKRYRHECVIGIKASDYMIRVSQTTQRDSMRPKRIIDQKLRFSKVCLEYWYELMHTMNPLDRFLTYSDGDQLKEQPEEPVFYVPVEKSKSRKLTKLKTVRMVQASLNQPTAKELQSADFRGFKRALTHNEPKTLKEGSAFARGAPESLGRLLQGQNSTRMAQIRATRIGANLNVTMIMENQDSSSEEPGSSQKVEFGFNEHLIQQAKPKPQAEVVITQSAAHRLSEKFMLEELLYSCLGLIYQRAKVLYVVTNQPEKAYKLLIRARLKIKQICKESIFSSHHYLHIKINLLLSKIMLEHKDFKGALMLMWENVSAYRTTCRIVFNPELENTRKVSGKFSQITKHFVLSLYQMSICYLNLEELSNMAFSVHLMSQICVAHLPRSDQLVSKVFGLIETYKLKIEPILMAQREMGNLILKLYEKIAPPNLDHLIDHKFEAKKREKTTDDDPHAFQEAELAVSLGYEPSLEHQFELKKEIRDTTKRYIRRLDTFIPKDLDTSLMTKFRDSQGSLSPYYERRRDIDGSSDEKIGSPPLQAFQRHQTQSSEKLKKYTNYPTSANSRPGSPILIGTPRQSEARSSIDKIPMQTMDTLHQMMPEADLDTLITSTRKDYEKTKEKPKPLSKIKLLHNLNPNHIQALNASAKLKIYQTSSPRSPPKSDLSLQCLLNEHYIKPSLTARPDSPKDWPTCRLDFSLLCQESHIENKQAKFHKEQLVLKNDAAPAVTDLVCERKERAPPAYQESLSHKFFEIKTTKMRERAERQQEQEKKVQLIKIRSEANAKFQSVSGAGSRRTSVFGTKLSLKSYQKLRSGEGVNESSQQSSESETGITENYTKEQKQVLKSRRKVQRKLYKIMEAHPDTFKIGSVQDCKRRLQHSPYSYILCGASHEYPKCQNHFKDTKDSILKNIAVIEKDNSVQDLKIKKLRDRGIYETGKSTAVRTSLSPGLNRTATVPSTLLTTFKKSSSDPDFSKNIENKASNTEEKKDSCLIFPKNFLELSKSTKGLEFQAFQSKESKPFKELFVRLKQGAKLSDFIIKQTKETKELSRSSESQVLLADLTNEMGVFQPVATHTGELEFEGSSVMS